MPYYYCGFVLYMRSRFVVPVCQFLMQKGKTALQLAEKQYYGCEEGCARVVHLLQDIARSKDEVTDTRFSCENISSGIACLLL